MYEQFVAAAPPPVLDTRTLISCRSDTGRDGERRIMAQHGLGVEHLLLVIFGTTVSVVPYVKYGLQTFYHTLPPNDVCFDLIVSHCLSSPCTAYHHLYLRALLDGGSHVCLP